MRHWINSAPAIIFFCTYLITKDFRVATVALMVAVVLQVLALMVCKLPVKPVEWSIFFMVLVFGGATLLLRENFYLQIKTTVINWLFAVTLLTADLGFKKNLVKGLLGDFFTAPLKVWRRVSLMLAAMFGLVGAANLVIIYHFSETVWVYAKTFGYLAFNFLVILGVIAYLMHHVEANDEQ